MPSNRVIEMNKRTQRVIIYNNELSKQLDIKRNKENFLIEMQIEFKNENTLQKRKNELDYKIGKMCLSRDYTIATCSHLTRKINRNS